MHYSCKMFAASEGLFKKTDIFITHIDYIYIYIFICWKACCNFSSGWGTEITFVESS